MSDIYLVRHGQASFGSANYDELSDLGYQQTRWLGEYFRARDVRFAHFLSGTLARHQQSLAALQQGLGSQLAHNALADYNEFDFNAVVEAYLILNPQAQPPSGAPRSAFYRLLKQAMLAWAAGHLDEQPLTETWLQFANRLHQALNHTRELAADGPVLVMTSGGAIAMALGWILGLAAEQVVNLNMQMKNSGFSHLYSGGSGLYLNTFNVAPHLDQLDRFNAITYS